MENTRSGKKGNKSFKLIILGLILVISISSFTAYIFYKNSLAPVSKINSDKIAIEIVSGTSTDKISEILYDNKLIKNKLVFKIQLKLSDGVGKLKAGNYELTQTMSLKDIINKLIQGGKSGDILTFTIPEGYELYLIANKLEKENIIDGEKFLDLVSDKKNFEEEFTFLKELDEDQSLEGFLFPSTYEVYKSASEEDIIRKMLKEFELIYLDTIKDRAAELNLSLNEIITMASLVEREARIEDERALIAGVYYNRLEIGMKLQCDATVLYALGDRRDVVLLEDLKIDSPYNTYKYYGLPIGPISSVGIPSIKAALYPEESDYLYYVAKKDGSHAFTKTLAEHEAATDKYLRNK